MKRMKNFMWHIRGQDWAPMYILAYDEEDAMRLILKGYKLKKADIIFDCVVED